MKTNLLKSTLVLVALCPALTLPAAPSHLAGELALNQVAAVTAANGDTVAPGTARIMVSLRLGSPSAVLADGSWLYSDYTAGIGDNHPVQHGTLVVRFTANKVTTLTLADKAAVAALRRAPPPILKDKIFVAADKQR